MYTAVPTCHVLYIYLCMNIWPPQCSLKKEGLVHMCGDSSLTKNSKYWFVSEHHNHSVNIATLLHAVRFFFGTQSTTCYSLLLFHRWGTANSNNSALQIFLHYNPKILLLRGSLTYTHMQNILKWCSALIAEQDVRIMFTPCAWDGTSGQIYMHAKCLKCEEYKFKYCDLKVKTHHTLYV